jgi:glycosyltransferase involved in cell wall biosynthesis
MKVAIVHDWLTGMRGGERCLEVFCELFPEADLYTLIYLAGRVSPTIRFMKLHPSWLNRLPGVRKYYRHCLPLFPRAIEGFDLAGYDLVLSSSHCVAKGVSAPDGLHISYVYSPMRYIWDMHDAYFGPEAPWLSRTAMALCRPFLQRWDVRSARRVDYFVAISHHIAEKIRKIYNREAAVIHPPVDVDRFRLADHGGDYYLIVSALVPYKRIDLAIQAFNRLDRRLRIVGEGPEEKRLKRIAGPRVEFLGEKSDPAVSELYAGCRALIFPGEEDFGIAPLEAQASGRPVIAYGSGGALETVVPLNPETFRKPEQICNRADLNGSATGVFFYQQTPEALERAVEFFEANDDCFDSQKLRDHAQQFGRERFKTQFQAFIEKCRSRHLKTSAAHAQTTQQIL